MPEGLGAGIGEGLHAIAQNLRQRENIRLVQRQKQADDLVEQMHSIRDNIAKVGLDSDQGKELATQLKDTIEKHNSLYGAHETPLLMQRVAGLFSHAPKVPVQHGENFMGPQQPAPAVKPRPEWRSFATEMATAPVQTWARDKDSPIPFKAANGVVYEAQRSSTGQTRWYPAAGVTPQDIDPQAIKDQRAAGMTPEEILQGAQIKAGLEPKATVAKPLEPVYHPTEGGLTAIKDPRAPGGVWDASNLGNAPPDIKERFAVAQAQHDSQMRAKQEAEDRRNAEAEKRQMAGIQAAVAASNASFQHALDAKDYTVARKSVNDAENNYQEAVNRQRTMEHDLENGLKGNQQSMISLVSNHIGMTLGAQKGARINRAVWDEAVSSAPWMESLRSKLGLDYTNETAESIGPKLLRGVTLTPEQMRQMVDLAHSKVNILGQDVADRKARYADELELNQPAPGNKKDATPAPSTPAPGWRIVPAGTK